MSHFIKTRFGRAMIALTLGGGTLFSAIAQAQTRYPWTPQASNRAGSDVSSSFYYYNDQSLRSALIKFASNFSIKISFSQVPAEVLDTRITGKFQVTDPSELLTKFSNSYGFLWFFYAGTLYITSNQTETRSLAVSPELVRNLKNVLMSEGLLDDRFGWSEISQEGTVVVSGPTKYVDLIEERIKKLKISPVGQEFAVFRLKYANADDVYVPTDTGDTLVMPGVATLLRAILSTGGGSRTGANSRLIHDVVEPIKNNLKSMMPAGTTLPTVSESTGGEGDRPASALSNAAVIEADSRLNTVIVRDKYTNMSVYKSLIDLLDIPAPLIQVEVMMIDVDQIKMNQAGVSWWGSFTAPNGSPISGGFGANNLSSSSSSSSSNLSFSYGNVSPGSLVVSGAGQFVSSLQFLEANGFAKVRTRSAVITIDNIAAIANLTQSFYAAAADGATTPVKANISLQVTPHVIFENDADQTKRIRLSVNLQDGNVQERLNNSLPSVIQGSLSSQAIIEEGNSLLMAGFTRTEIEDSQIGVPLLSDIPVLGWLFKQKTSKEREYQRSYLITPKLIWHERDQEIPNYSVVTPE